METKQLNVTLDIKEVSDEGTFEGIASVYGVVDEVGDVVEKGAFTRTIKAIQSKAEPTIPILWRHDSPIGKGTIEDTPKGLYIKGKLTLAVAQAKEALALMKDGVVRGLSIGFRSNQTQEKLDDAGVRHLHEVKLYEVSLTPFPACPGAEATKVKESEPMQRKDFTEELNRVQTLEAGYMMMSALRESLYKCMDADGTPEERAAEAAKCIDQFKSEYVAWFQKYVSMMQEMYGMKESKEARTMIESILTDSRAALEKYQALLEKLSGSTSEQKELAPPTPEPADPGSGPAVDHSELSNTINQLREVYRNA